MSWYEKVNLEALFDDGNNNEQVKNYIASSAGDTEVDTTKLQSGLTSIRLPVVGVVSAAPLQPNSFKKN